MQKDLLSGHKPTKHDLFTAIEQSATPKRNTRPAHDPRYDGLPRLGMKFGRSAFEHHEREPRSRNTDPRVLSGLVRVFRARGSTSYEPVKHENHPVNTAVIRRLYLNTALLHVKQAKFARRRLAEMGATDCIAGTIAYHMDIVRAYRARAHAQFTQA
jgi:hypothetical protein